MVSVAVLVTGTVLEDACVEASFVDKVEAACESVVTGCAGTAGDGTNDVLVSVVVDAGPVTGGGIDAVTYVVGTISTCGDLWSAADVTDTLCCIMCKTY